MYTQKLLLTAAFLSALSSSPAYAANEVPTDPFSGEPIEWDIDDIAGEDEAGLETDPITIPKQEQGTQDTATIPETEPPITESVTIQLGGKGGSLEDGNILLILYRDGYHREDIILRASDGFYKETKLPVGKYTFGKAESDSGKSYTLEETTFTLSEGEPARIILREKTAEEENIMETYEIAEIPSETEAKTSRGIIGVIAGVILFGIIGVTAFIWIRKQ